MRITEIHFIGDGNSHATINRPLGSDTLHVKIADGTSTVHHEVHLIDTEHQLSMAQTLQVGLTGNIGTTADVAQYYKAIRLMVDL